jgi:hypothetical protein
MDNGVMAGPGGQVAARPLGVRVALVLAGVALVMAALIVFQRPASAQIGIPDIRALLCSILNSLAAAFGGFLRPIISTIAAALGCGTVSGG